MIEYRPQETGTDLGLFQLLFAKCQPPEEVQKTHQIIEHMLEYLSKYELSCLARVNRTFYGFINQSVFFNRVKSRPENLRKLSDLLAAYHNPHLSEEAVTILRNGIIAALRRGDDPTQITPDQNYFLIGAQGNSVLTAALVNRDELLINVVFDIFEPGHPLFSLRDMAFCGKNTPLSLALKTGRYDLAQRLIVEKNCDVDGLIGDSKYTSIHSLHLCAFLLGTFYGKDDEQEKKLVSIMKAILKRSQNKDLRLFWGQTPLDILQADISHQDFECYEDRRKFFEFHCGSLFTSEQVEMGNYIMNEIISKIAVSRRWIHYYQQDGEPDKGAKHQRDLEKAEQEYAQIEDKHHGLIKFAEALVELSEFEVQGHSIKDYQQLQQYQAEYKKLLADIHERLPEIAAFHTRQKIFSLRELTQKYGDPDQFPSFYHYTKLRTRIFNVHYMLQDHCYWHRDDMLSSETYDRRVNYFNTEEGARMREELSALMRPCYEPEPNFKLNL